MYVLGYGLQGSMNRERYSKPSVLILRKHRLVAFFVLRVEVRNIVRA
jgi:hypothetical protein